MDRTVFKPTELSVRIEPPDSSKNAHIFPLTECYDSKNENYLACNPCSYHPGYWLLCSARISVDVSLGIPDFPICFHVAYAVNSYYGYNLVCTNFTRKISPLVLSPSSVFNWILSSRDTKHASALFILVTLETQKHPPRVLLCYTKKILYAVLFRLFRSHLKAHVWLSNDHRVTLSDFRVPF